MMGALRQLGCAATMPLVAATAVTIQAPRALHRVGLVREAAGQCTASMRSWSAMRA